MDGLMPCQCREGGARAPLEGVLPSTSPSGGHWARSAGAQEFITKVSRSFRKQEQYAATAAHLALLPTSVRVVSYASASTSQGSTELHLRSASSLRVLGAARAHLTATFACRSACRAWLLPSNATSRASWRVRRPGTTQSWRRWRRSSRNHLGPRATRGSGPRWIVRSNPFATRHQLPQHPFNDRTR